MIPDSVLCNFSPPKLKLNIGGRIREKENGERERDEGKLPYQRDDDEDERTLEEGCSVVSYTVTVITLVALLNF